MVQKRDDPFEDLYEEEIVMSISDEWQYPEICLKLEGAMPGNDVCADVEFVFVFVVFFFFFFFFN